MVESMRYDEDTLLAMMTDSGERTEEEALKILQAVDMRHLEYSILHTMHAVLDAAADSIGLPLKSVSG